MKAEAEIEVMPRNAKDCSELSETRRRQGVSFPKIKQKQGTANISVSDF